MDWKHLAIVTAGVVAAQFVVPQVFAMTGMKTDPNSFGLDDVVLAAMTAAVIVLVDKVL